MIARVREFAELSGGRYTGEDHACAGVSTDTRTLRPGEIYLALRGPRFDGNEFLDAAAAAGAVAAVVDRPVRDAPLPLIEVDDGQLALTRAASNWRASFKGVVVGVAGSNGKTTVKEMTSAILSGAGHLPRDARQPEQPHRCSADAAAPDAGASLCRDRDRRQSAG